MAAKDEVRRSLLHLVERLGTPGVIDGMSKFQLKGAAEYALEQLALVQELKRARPSTAVKDSTGAAMPGAAAFGGLFHAHGTASSNANPNAEITISRVDGPEDEAGAAVGAA